jgi:hypothetical protein
VTVDNIKIYEGEYEYLVLPTIDKVYYEVWDNFLLKNIISYKMAKIKKLRNSVNFERIKEELKYLEPFLENQYNNEIWKPISDYMLQHNSRKNPLNLLKKKSGS